MSTADDLKNVWNKFKSPEEPNLEVYWNLQNPKFQYDGDNPTVYIMNLRSIYNPDLPGHWIAMVRTSPTDVFYYDSFGSILTKRGIKNIDTRYLYENVIKEQNFIGENSDSCGYYCILFLLAFIRGFKKYRFVVFDKKLDKFITTIPDDHYIKINFDAIKTEIANNELCE